MTFDQGVAVLIGALVLIGGPVFLVNNALERHKARKAEAWRLSPAGFQHHVEVAAARVDSLGPFSLAEHEVLLFNLLWVSSHQGAVTWEGIITQAGIARQIVRDHARRSADADPAGAADDVLTPEDAGPDEAAIVPKPEAPLRPRH